MLLVDELTLALRRSSPSDPPLAVLYLDLDRFKDINDTLGHAAGDEVLRQFARRLGELVLGEHGMLAARSSIGIALAASAADDAESLLRRADAAMYHAKHRTRAAWALHDGALDALAARRIAVERDLRTALGSDGFRLRYQPIVDLVAGRMVGVEALLRLEHPTEGLLAPDAFIDVAEDTDLILPIGAWVMQEATRQLARWQARRPDLQLAVNVSARQVRHLVLLDLVRGAAEQNGTDLADLNLEITERVLLEANDDVLADALGLGTVAEGVETQAQADLLRAAGCQQAQGFHLGRPRTAEAVDALLG